MTPTHWKCVFTLGTPFRDQMKSKQVLEQEFALIPHHGDLLSSSCFWGRYYRSLSLTLYPHFSKTPTPGGNQLHGLPGRLVQSWVSLYAGGEVGPGGL